MIENDIKDFKLHTIILKSFNEIELDKIQLLNIEQDYLDFLKPNLNMINAIRR